MEKELLEFIIKNEISPFNEEKTCSRIDSGSIFKTRDAKSTHTKVINNLSSKFIFSQTKNLWDYFSFTKDFSIIKKRQDFFKTISKVDNSYMKDLERPRRKWKPRYGIVVVTEDESTFIKLKEIGCTAQLLYSENEILDLEKYDIVQVVDCSDFRILLERIPQTIFIDQLENVYLERYLEILSGWRENFRVLRNNPVSPKIKNLLEKLEPLFNLLDNKEGKIITEEEVERVLEEINEKISEKIKEVTISGDSLLKILAQGKIPLDILDVVKNSIQESGLNEHLFNLQIPVTIDYDELEAQIKRQSANEFTDMASRVKKSAEELKAIPKILEELSALIVLEDFKSGVSQKIDSDFIYPILSQNFHMSKAKNIFLNPASPVSFQLDSFSRCSILTGANSGGKTTLLEHILQNISLFQMGLPISGEVHMPIFTDVYYFAKNKGSASKGAFETLLTQMSNIKPGSSTLILADEIEAVTEPGVAGKIISATAKYFIDQNCFLVVATHLGYEIQKNLPEKTRIDGIEAKGLDENFNLIVDHNPIMGRLAHSTPELIVERMANYHKGEYFEFLNKSLKKD